MTFIKELDEKYKYELIHITKLICEIEKKYKFKKYHYYYNMFTYIYLLSNYLEYKYLDAAIIVFQSFDLRIEWTKLLEDLIQYHLGLCSKNKFGKSDEFIISKYTDDYLKVEERMMLRKELLKCGWSIEKIESYLKQKKIVTYNTEIAFSELYDVYLYNLVVYSGEEIKEPCQKIGRPRIPESVKEYMRKIYNDKMREVMREKYSKCEKFNNNLLTKEEWDSIRFKINDELILKKLVNFVSE